MTTTLVIDTEIHLDGSFTISCTISRRSFCATAHRGPMIFYSSCYDYRMQRLLGPTTTGIPRVERADQVALLALPVCVCVALPTSGGQNPSFMQEQNNMMSNKLHECGCCTTSETYMCDRPQHRQSTETSTTQRHTHGTVSSNNNLLNQRAHQAKSKIPPNSIRIPSRGGLNEPKSVSDFSRPHIHTLVRPAR